MPTLHAMKAWVSSCLRRRPGVMRTGPGCGLRFDPGSGNPEYATGANEQPVQRALADHLRGGNVFFDVGANVGYLSVIAARLVGEGGRVVAFEPVPANAKQVRRNAALNGFGNVDVVEVAVTDRCGRGQLILAEFAGGASLSDADRPPDACGEMPVGLTTLDQWLATGAGPAPDFVKIDVEGAELSVLRGMHTILSRHRPVVLVEVDDAHQGAADAKTAACRAFLEERAYRVTRLPDSYPDIAWHVAHLLALPGPEPESGNSL